jgi:hypothetical protein
MKRILFFLSFIMIVMASSSCKKEYITKATPNQTILQDISPAEWIASSTDQSYYYDISVPEIDNYFNDNGGMLAYISYDNQPGVYEQIPEVYNGVSYSYTSNQGVVRIYAQSYDGSATFIPSGLRVKLILIPSIQ